VRSLFRRAVEIVSVLACLFILPRVAQAGRNYAVVTLGCCLASAIYFLCSNAHHFSRWSFRVLATVVVTTGILMTAALYELRSPSRSVLSRSEGTRNADDRPELSLRLNAWNTK
jgi:hypothetical protein